MNDAERMKHLDTFDPLAGSLIDSMNIHAGQVEPSLSLAFAEGETGCSLCKRMCSPSHTGPSSIPALIPVSTTNARRQTGSQIVKTFSTPILQIRASGSSMRDETPSFSRLSISSYSLMKAALLNVSHSRAHIAVRTMGSLSVHEVKATLSGTFAASDIAKLCRADIGDGYAVDTQFVRNGRLAVVNEHGTLYDWQPGAAKPLRCVLPAGFELHG
jgi:hypothetical protein